jgi:addiction module HigA family antidote
MFKNGMRAVHPGQVLQEDYLKPLGLSVKALAKALGVPTSRMNDIVKEHRGVSADTALRLQGHCAHGPGCVSTRCGCRKPQITPRKTASDRLTANISSSPK